MKASIKKQLLHFIAKELLDLNPVKMSSSESRKNREGNRTVILAKDSKNNKYSLHLAVINTKPDGVLISVDVRDINWPDRSNINPEHFDFKVAGNNLEHGQLSKHRLVECLPKILPKELHNKI